MTKCKTCGAPRGARPAWKWRRPHRTAARLTTPTREPMTEERIDRVAEAMANEARKRHGLDHMWLELMPNKADWRSRARAAIAALAADAEERRQ